MDQPAAYQTPIAQVDREDKINKTTSMYEVGYGEIFWKNFLAGFGRAFGGIFIYGVFLAISLYIFLSYGWPIVKPFIQEYQQAIQGLNQFQGKTTTPGAGPGVGSNGVPYKQFIQDLQQSLPTNK